MLGNFYVYIGKYAKEEDNRWFKFISKIIFHTIIVATAIIINKGTLFVFFLINILAIVLVFFSYKLIKKLE